jgi:hypothetical protein
MLTIKPFKLFSREDAETLRNWIRAVTISLCCFAPLRASSSQAFSSALQERLSAKV